MVCTVGGVMVWCVICCKIILLNLLTVAHFHYRQNRLKKYVQTLLRIQIQKMDLFDSLFLYYYKNIFFFKFTLCIIPGPIIFIYSVASDIRANTIGT